MDSSLSTIAGRFGGGFGGRTPMPVEKRFLINPAFI